MLKMSKIHDALLVNNAHFTPLNNKQCVNSANGVIMPKVVAALSYYCANTTFPFHFIRFYDILLSYTFCSF